MINQSKYIFVIIFIFIGSFFIFSFLSDPMHSLTDGPDDVFYYLTYSRELANGNLFSWNGIYPSTGFHPLWLFITTLPFFFTENLNIIIPILSIFLFSLFLLSLKFFYQLINNLFKDQFIKLIGIFLFSFLSANCFFWYMETALSITLFLGYCSIAFLNKQIKYSLAIYLGAISSLLVLSRMDMVLVIAPIHALLILRSLKDCKWFKLAIMTFMPIIIVGSYMLILFIITGTPLPLSGAIKSTFPHFFMLTRWNVLINYKWHGLLASSIAIISLVGYALSSFFVKIERNIKITNSLLYCLVFGGSLNVIYHISFTRTGEIGSWYFAIHYYISIITILYFLSNLKKIAIIENKNFTFFEKIFSKIAIIFSLILLFFVCFIDRFNHNFRNSQPFAYKKYVEFLEKSNFNKKSRIYDESDGSFAYFSKMPTYHRKGMAATPDYVLLQKKFIFKNGIIMFGEELGRYLESEKIDYIIRLKAVVKNTYEEKCILDNAKYVMLANQYKEKNEYVYLIKTEDYQKNFCFIDS